MLFLWAFFMSIIFSGISTAFGTKQVLKDINFEVSTMTFLLGKSGAGKSVTLKHIMGQIPIQQGSITLDGSILSPQSRSLCGMVFQQPALFDSMNIFDNIAFGLKTGNKKERVLELLHHVDLDPSIVTKMPHDLSYGMQKRVSIARTLAPNPRYLLFDEPTTGLDPLATRLISDLIMHVANTCHVTCLVVSHDIGSALRIANHILFLDDCRIVASGDPKTIQLSTNPLVQAFLGRHAVCSDSFVN